MALPRIPSDPALKTCPDFALPEWDVARAEMIREEGNITEERAIALLARGWKAGNSAEKTLWALQLQRDQQAEQLRGQELDADVEREREDKERERLELVEEDRRKNKLKYVPVPQRPLIGRRQPHIIAQIAIDALRKGGYIELHYFTRKGMADALANPKRAVDTATFGHDEDGNVTLVSKASIDATKGLVPDEEQTMEQLNLAAPIFIEEAGHAGWLPDRIRMLADFWQAIQEHDWRWHTDPLKTKALMVYQAQQRRRWHMVMLNPNPERGYSLALINEDILLETFHTLLTEELRRTASANARDFRKRTFPSPSRDSMADYVSPFLLFFPIFLWLVYQSRTSITLNAMRYPAMRFLCDAIPCDAIHVMRYMRCDTRDGLGSRCRSIRCVGIHFLIRALRPSQFLEIGAPPSLRGDGRSRRGQAVQSGGPLPSLAHVAEALRITREASRGWAEPG